MSFRKGQVEFVAIAAIILIALIVIILALQQTAVQPPPVTGIEQEAKTVKDSVNTLIRTGLKEQMKLIYNQGGMLTPQSVLNVDFGMFKVPVWQACDQVSIPDIEKEIEAGIGAYIMGNLETEEEFAKKKVVFDFNKMDIDVDILKDNIRVKVDLPTKIEEYSIPQPYEVSVPTKLYDILEFSRNFVTDNTQGRIFEGALIRCMTKFPTDPDSEDWLRPFGVLTGCGEMIHKTKTDLISPMRKAITLSVTQVLWNEKPLRSIDKNCFTPVNVVGGKTYPDLEVYFEYPPSWDLNQNFLFSPNPINFVATPMMSFVPICVTPFFVSYNVRHPIIVHVEDSLTNQMFNFAIISEITNTMPGNCSLDLEEVESDYMQLCVNQANCQAKITVRDRQGSPIEGADVTYDICSVGRTDANGVAEGAIPCGLAELHVYKNGYKSYGDFLPASEIEDKTIELTEVQENITLHFNGVPLKCINVNRFGTNQLNCQRYSVIRRPRPILELGSLTAFSSFSPRDTSIWVPEDMDLVFDNYAEGGLVNTRIVEGLYPNTFDVSAFVTRNFEMMLGYVDASFGLGETNKDIYLYLPVVLRMDDDEFEETDINESIGEGEAEQLGTVLRNCGINPVSTSPQNPTCV
ncbi:MAG: hypothetical protein GTN38_04390 [Candidatus Aenigmarchaeota archaeon]|nr:hypothetical protein [Candidatus Aenigmarchaeota archaeon]NIQ18113.1 hypothetical protein [Candidatus Aenigmarchaeota archaeon]